MTVIKRGKQESSKDLLTALDEFMGLLEDQDEGDAIAHLKAASDKLRNAKADSPQHSEAAKSIVEAFEGEHELGGYILSRANPDEWDITQQLSQSGTRVLNLAKRLCR